MNISKFISFRFYVERSSFPTTSYPRIVLQLGSRYFSKGVLFVLCLTHVLALHQAVRAVQEGPKTLNLIPRYICESHTSNPGFPAGPTGPRGPAGHTQSPPP